MVFGIETYETEKMGKKVEFDFEVYVTDGRSIKGTAFQFEILGDSVSDKELGEYIEDELNLSKIGQVTIFNKKILSEPYDENPICEKAEAGLFIDLSHTIEHGLSSKPKLNKAFSKLGISLTG